MGDQRVFLTKDDSFGNNVLQSSELIPSTPGTNGATPAGRWRRVGAARRRLLRQLKLASSKWTRTRGLPSPRRVGGADNAVQGRKVQATRRGWSRRSGSSDTAPWVSRPKFLRSPTRRKFASEVPATAPRGDALSSSSQSFSVHIFKPCKNSVNLGIEEVGNDRSKFCPKIRRRRSRLQHRRQAFKDWFQYR